jgi:chemotaxis-related protein WspD
MEVIQSNSGSIVPSGLPGRMPRDANCWSHIGVSGDRTCPELEKFIHCRNCPVFATAARAFFDRPAPDGYLAEWALWLGGTPGSDALEEGEGPDAEEIRSHGDRESILVFRLGDEWLAFSTQTVAEVTTLRPVHRVPHRSNEIFVGLLNLHGQTELCVSLHGLLGAANPGSGGRLVVLYDRAHAEKWAFQADEVLGVQYVPRSHWRSVPSTLIDLTVGFTQAIVAWKGRSIGLLDEQRTFTALRSLRT